MACYGISPPFSLVGFERHLPEAALCMLLVSPSCSFPCFLFLFGRQNQGKSNCVNREAYRFPRLLCGLPFMFVFKSSLALCICTEHNSTHFRCILGPHTFDGASKNDVKPSIRSMIYLGFSNDAYVCPFCSLNAKFDLQDPRLKISAITRSSRQTFLKCPLLDVRLVLMKNQILKMRGSSLGYPFSSPYLVQIATAHTIRYHTYQTVTIPSIREVARNLSSSSREP